MTFERKLKNMKSYMKYILSVAASVLITLTATAQQKLSLQEAVALTIENNPALKATALDVNKAQQQKIISRSLFLPSVNAIGQANHYFNLTPFFGFGGIPAEGKIPYGRFGGEDQLAASVTAIQPLFNPVAYPSLHYARLKEQESRLSLNGNKIALLSLVKQTYLQVLVINERIKIQQESIKRNRLALQDARSLFLQGKGIRVDTLRAYTTVKNLEPELLKLKYAEETGKLQLKALIGIDSLSSLELTDSLSLPNPETIPTEEEVYNLAKGNNSDYQLVALQEQITEQQAKTASAARLPVVSVIGAYQVNSQTRKLDYANAYYPTSSYVGLQVAVPLFTGMSNQAKVKQANIGKEQSALRSKNAYEQLRAIVHQTVADSHESLARLQTTNTVKETAQLSYSIIQYRYKKGISSRLELTDAELALSTAQSNYLEAVYDYLSAQIALLKLMGRVE
jgi:outer membrane protein TolC